MKKLPIKLKRIIKRERFSFNNLKHENNWQGGMDIDYRITMVKAEGEDYYSHITPMNLGDWNTVSVNLKVKGSVQVRKSYGGDKTIEEISQACTLRKNGWGGYSEKYDSIWGYQIHKRVRKEIRDGVITEIKNYLKIFGIKSKTWNGGIQINKITFEK